MLWSTRFVLFLVSSLSIFMQASVTFNHQVYNGFVFNTQVDLNGDGIPGFIGQGPNLGQFQVTLSNANGTYQSPVIYHTINDEPFSTFVAADFNRDGNADLVVVIDGSGPSSGPGYEVFLGNGTGVLTPPKSKIKTPPNFGFVVTSDFNHDNKLDLVFADANGKVWLALGQGNGTFAAPTQVFDAGGSFESMLTGDFDGDGNADVAIGQQVCPPPCHLRLFGLFGNGKGAFQSVVTSLPASESDVGQFTTFDLNKDGRSDLLALGGDQINPFVMVAYGGVSRTFNVKIVPAGISPDVAWPNFLTLVAAADLNGDGLNDIIYAAIQQGTSVLSHK